MSELSEALAAAIKTFIAERYAEKLEAFEKEASKKRAEASDEDLPNAEASLEEKKLALAKYFQLSVWLSDAARRAWQISMVSHAPKYTHSDTKASGILFRPTEVATEHHASHLSSASVHGMPIDVIGNAAALDVARLLQTEVQGHTLWKEISTGESPSLRLLADSQLLYDEWMEGFKAALRDKDVRSGSLSKQVYYPAGASYHLLSPLFATSLAQVIHDRLTDTFFSEESKSIRKQRTNGKYSPNQLVTFLNVAVQAFGGTKPQNISQLNTKRYGRSYLLSCQPPTWHSQSFLPTKGKHAFWREYDRRTRRTAKHLQDYLHKNLKLTSTAWRRDYRANLVDELVESLLILAAEIQSQHEKAGWSENSDLSRAEQLWLDPLRAKLDSGFQSERGTNQWQGAVAEQFATWLNRKLSYRSDAIHMTDAEHNEWQKILERKLTLLQGDLEVHP